MAMRCYSLLQRRGAVSVRSACRAVGPRRGKLVTTCYTEGPATPDTKKTKVEFVVPHHVEFGQEICLVGETEGLGKWEVEHCVPMIWTDGDVWTAKADVPAGSHIQYKYVIRSSESGEVVEWQPCDNLELDVPETDIPSFAPIVVQDAWEGDEHVVHLEGKAEATTAQAIITEPAELPQVSIEAALEEIIDAPVVPVAEAVLQEVMPEVVVEKPADAIPQVEDVLPAAVAAAGVAAAGVNGSSDIENSGPTKAKKKNGAQRRRK